MKVLGEVPRVFSHEIAIFSHFGHDQSSPGLSLVPIGILKPRNLPKKLSKRERRQTNGYQMRFIVNFNWKHAMWQFGIILPLILPIPLETETTEIKIGNAFNLYRLWVFNTHTCTHTHAQTHLTTNSKWKVTEMTGNGLKWQILLESVNIGFLIIKKQGLSWGKLQYFTENWYTQINDKNQLFHCI